MEIKYGFNKEIKHVELEGEGVIACPFCGSIDISLCNTHSAAYWMECQGCGAEISGTSYANSDTEESHLASAKSALANWNHRVAK